MSSSSKTLEGDLAQTLRKVNDFVDDDLLSCFLWAAGENAVAQPGWESPSVHPLKGIPLPPNMPPLPPAGKADDPESTGLDDDVLASGGSPAAAAGGGGGSSLLGGPSDEFGDLGDGDDDCDDDEFGAIKEMGDDAIEDIAKMTSSGTPLSKEQKLTQRMQRKAESARVARLRKKEYVTGLEDQIKDLTTALAAAREKNKQQQQQQQGAAKPAAATPGSVERVEPRLREEGQRQLSHMDALLKQPTLDKLEVNATVEQYVSNKRAQQQVVNDYLDCIEDILSPAAPLQVAFNPESATDEAFASDAAAAASTGQSLLHKPNGGSGSAATSSSIAGASSAAAPAAAPAAAEEAAPAPAAAEEAAVGEKRAEAEGAEGEGDDGDEPREAKRQRRESVGSQLMGTLANELGLNASQVDSLSAQKGFIRSDREIVSGCMSLIKQLRSRVAEHIQSSQRITDHLRRILEPAQVAQFLLWVERNQRSMNLLNSIVATE